MKKSFFFKLVGVAAVLMFILWGQPHHIREAFAQTEDMCVTLVQNLSRGNRGEQVANLQRWLMNEGFDIPSLRSGGQFGVFGPQTQKALTEYQKSTGMTKGLGFFGPVTRGKIARACGTPSQDALQQSVPGAPSINASPAASAPKKVSGATAISVALLVNGAETVSVSPKTHLSFSWKSKNATYCHNSSEAPLWSMWKGKQIEGSVAIPAPDENGKYTYSLTCGSSHNLHTYATSTVSVDVQ